MGRSATCFSCGAVVAVFVTGSACAVQKVDQRRADCADARPDEVGVCRHPDRSFAEPACCQVQVARQCDVVAATLGDTGELQQSQLASLYAIDDQGERAFDDAATYVAITVTGGGADATVGTERFSSAAEDRIEPIDEPSVHEELTEYETYRLAHGVDVDSFTLRLFTAFDLGVLLHSHPSYEHGSRRVATVDCRGVLRSAPVPTFDPADVRCAVVWLDPALAPVGDGLGTIYDLSSDGRYLADVAVTGVSIRQTLEGWAIELGQQRFSEQQGDAVDPPSDPVGSAWSWRVAAADWQQGQELGVRVFADSGLGLLQWSAAATGEDVSHFAVLDCRALPVVHGGE